MVISLYFFYKICRFHLFPYTNLLGSTLALNVMWVVILTCAFTLKPKGNSFGTSVGYKLKNSLGGSKGVT